MVEDHEDSRDALRQFLEHEGARVLLAADGRDALTVLRAEAPDVILCDLRMPGMDGFGFMARLRSEPKLARLRVIAVSALGADTDLVRTWAAGFDGHVIKPVEPDTMLATIERLLWARSRTGS